jgi:hypothetical protein
MSPHGLDRRFSFVLLAVLILFITSCGRSSQQDPEQTQIAWLVTTGMEDTSKQGGAFAPESMPKKQELERYSKFKYQMQGKPSIDGDTAKVQMNITGDKGSGQKEWTLVKKNGQWFVKDAPLP